MIQSPSILVTLLAFALVLGPLVFFHELGHYLVGRWFGVKVVTFSIGFGPELIGFDDRKGTHWRVAAIPLGGYVRFFGDANAASMPDAERNKLMTPQERGFSLFHKPVWQRIAVVAAGPIANFILAAFVFAAAFSIYGYPTSDAVVGAVKSDPAQLVTDAVKRIAEGLTGDRGVSLVDLFASPEQRAIIDRVTGVMSLLEGHADVVMDGVGPEVIPSVAEIREKFNRRRKGIGGLDRILRRLLGLDQKMAQYRDGAVFVRACVDAVGMDGFNAVWAEPANLPTTAEIHDPDAWVRRIHG